MNKIIPIAPSRSCGECTKCCEGWVVGEVYGYKFSPGQPCHYLEKNCSIYPDRPNDPCRSFNCVWITDHTFPAWLKPSLSNIIILTRLDKNNEKIYYFKETGVTMRADVLNWIFLWAANNSKNIVYTVNDGTFIYGSDDFTKNFNLQK